MVNLLCGKGALSLSNRAPPRLDSRFRGNDGEGYGNDGGAQGVRVDPGSS